MDQARTKKAKANYIKPDAIGHKSSPQEFREQIEAVYRLIGHYLGQTLDEFQMGFERDSRPAYRVALWCRIASVWYEYHDRFLDGGLLSDDQEKKIVAALIAISAGQRDTQSLSVATEVGARLLTCFKKRQGA
jgi:hypothetical protein